MSEKERIFSGERSRELWAAIKATFARQDVHAALYLLACRCQELEEAMRGAGHTREQARSTCWPAAARSWRESRLEPDAELERLQEDHEAGLASLRVVGQRVMVEQELAVCHDALAAAAAALDPEQHAELSARLSRLLAHAGGPCTEYQCALADAREAGRQEERRLHALQRRLDAVAEREIGRREERRACHDAFSDNFARWVQNKIAERGPMAPSRADA